MLLYVLELMTFLEILPKHGCGSKNGCQMEPKCMLLGLQLYVGQSRRQGIKRVLMENTSSALLRLFFFYACALYATLGSSLLWGDAGTDH